MFKTYKEIIESRCEKFADKDVYAFLADGEEKVERISYGKFLKYVYLVAGNLQKQLQSGDRVLILCPPGIEYNLSFIACSFAGTIPVPLYPPDTRSLERVVSIIKDCNPKAAIANVHTIEKFFGDNSQEFIKKNVKDNPLIAGVIKKIRFFDIENLKKTEGNLYKNIEVKPEDVMYLQYTSGSTSSPKGVMVTHDNLVYNTHYIANFFGQDENEIAISWIPPFHDMGLIKDVLTTIYSGTTLYFMAPNSFIRKPVRWLNAITKYSKQGYVNSGGPNFAYDLCVKTVSEEQINELDLSNWKIAYNGSEPVHYNTLETFYNKFKKAGLHKNALEPVYGLAESTLMVAGPLRDNNPIVRHVDKAEMTKNKVEEIFSGKDAIDVVCCGKTIPEQETLIVNPETFEPCPENVIGEIWVKGRSVAAGYYNNEKETQRTFKAYLAGDKNGPFLRTGDLGFLVENKIQITGRLKDLIIINGSNHYPQDIEITAYMAHDALRPNGGIAFSIPKDETEKLIIVYEVKRSSLKNINSEDIVNAIKSAVFQKHSIPVYEVVLVESSSIPKTTSGKLQRRLCLQQYMNNDLHRIDVKIETEQ